MIFKVGLTAAFLVAATATLSQAALGQETQPLGDVLSATHVHGLVPQENAGEVLMATHHGLWSVDIDQETARLLGNSRDDFMGFSVHPTDKEVFWASGHPITGGNLGIIGSVDGGANWSQIAEGIGGPVDFHQMTVSVADPDVIYGVYRGTSLQRSQDAGRSWVEIGLLPDGMIDLAASAVSPDTVYAATNSGLFKSDDVGRSWVRIYESTAPVSSVDVNADGIHAFVLGTGVVHSLETDVGFSTVADNFGDTYLLHATPTSDGGYVAATDQGGLILLSPDGDVTKSIPQ
ncbi:WD40/YVTN/BNR-like repeat-containing protein [Pelagibacterium sp.]|uniref:WD40/YVTN/BNR-like repeat-containing protein n=1 Tax=Pelagibacterium sp. TaxID=1967288 RepID=UPI003BABC9EF